MNETIIPENCFGEQYADDIALVFKPNEIIYQTQTKYQKVDIIKTESYGQILFLDNLLMKTEKDGHIINEMIVHPVMLTGRKKQKALVVGGGEGFTTTLLLKYPYIEQIDVIDIDNDFIEICRKYYPEQTKCFNDERVKLIVQDGLDYLRTTNEVYDAIFITPTDPFSLSMPLFVDEYYKLCFEHLAEDGIIQTDGYMPFYKYGDIDFAVIDKNISKYFPITKTYIATVPTFPGGLFAFVIGSKKDDPIKDQKAFDFNIETEYYNKEIHKACFGLPQFMIERLEEEKNN